MGLTGEMCLSVSQLKADKMNQWNHMSPYTQTVCITWVMYVNLMWTLLTYSINKWCSVSENTASERSTQAALSPDVKVLSVTGSCSRVTYIKAARKPLHSAFSVNSCKNTAVFRGGSTVSVIDLQAWEDAFHSLPSVCVLQRDQHLSLRTLIWEGSDSLLVWEIIWNTERKVSTCSDCGITILHESSFYSFP